MRNEGAVVLIPAYRPSEALTELLKSLTASRLVRAVVVVDDGSGPEFHSLFDSFSEFDEPLIIRHRENLGKGAALKTGLGHIARLFPDGIGVVTADADGQHTARDTLGIVKALGNRPGALILGVRSFGRKVPFRCRIGNLVVVNLLSLMAGRRITDTQTGLRGIPMSFVADLLDSPCDGYEFETDMLLQCVRKNIEICEVKIETIYIDGNCSSHFDPVLDSVRICRVLLRFGASSRRRGRPQAARCSC